MWKLWLKFVERVIYCIGHAHLSLVENYAKPYRSQKWLQFFDQLDMQLLNYQRFFFGLATKIVGIWDRVVYR